MIFIYRYIGPRKFSLRHFVFKWEIRFFLIALYRPKVVSFGRNQNKMETSTISSCIRFFERMAERVKRMEEEEARLTKESCKTIRAPILTKTRRSSGFGKGMVRKDKWRPGQPRITQEACVVVAEYAKARAIAQKNGHYVGRKSYADRAGISTATLNRCANEIVSGEIYLDRSSGLWKAAPVQSLGNEEKTTAANTRERDKNPHGVPSQVVLV